MDAETKEAMRHIAVALLELKKLSGMPDFVISLAAMCGDSPIARIDAALVELKKIVDVPEIKDKTNES